MQFLYLKAIHLVFLVSWFAALFYIVRLFIYTAEAQLKDETAKLILTPQLLLMQRRLWNIIGWPALVGTFTTGIWMFTFNYDFYLAQPWMRLKLFSVVLLLIYHLLCQLIMSQQHRGQFTITSFRLRLFNEAATVLLVAIVFLVILRSASGLLYGLAGLFAFACTLMFAVYLYKKSREKKRG